METASPFKDLTPEPLWRHFKALTAIARPSGEEAATAAYIMDWARTAGLECKQDAAGNIAVHVAASAGAENAPAVILQGHMDMVCERDSDSPYDAKTGNIHVVRDADWIKAEGTTLGADNGIGVAAAMAVAEDKTIQHGPLDLLFTVDEETGLNGAFNLDPAILRGKMMLNLDSEEDGVIYVGCAGGCDTALTLTSDWTGVPADWQCLRVSVQGLTGGHSGCDINKNRLNAIKALALLLHHAGGQAPVRLCKIEGGNKRNAIPREAVAEIALPAEAVDGFTAKFQEKADLLAAQYQFIDEGFKAAATAIESPEKPAACSPEDTRRLIHLLLAMPCGVIAMSMDIKGMVETSTNLGVVSTIRQDGGRGDGAITLLSCSRSSDSTAMRHILDSLVGIGALAGAEVKESGEYPGWQPDLSSRLLATARKVYNRISKKEPVITAIHAGLECGIIGEKIPGMEMISFGPDIKGAHSPQERIYIPSVARFWTFLSLLLEKLSE